LLREKKNERTRKVGPKEYGANNKRISCVTSSDREGKAEKQRILVKPGLAGIGEDIYQLITQQDIEFLARAFWLRGREHRRLICHTESKETAQGAGR